MPVCQAKAKAKGKSKSKAMEAAIPPASFFMDVAPEDLESHAARHGGKIYCVWSPPSARGIWIGSRSHIRSISARGEKKPDFVRAFRGCRSSETPVIRRAD